MQLSWKQTCELVRSGQWFGVHKDTTNTTFVYCWDEEKRIGQKYCVSNAFKERVRDKHNDSGHLSSKIIPEYDFYKLSFNLCDVFNRRLKNAKWPHKRGSKGVAGEWGHMNNFAFSCTLRNTFNAYEDLTNSHVCFQDNCIALADELYEYAAIL